MINLILLGALGAIGVALTTWAPAWTLLYYAGIGAAVVRRVFSKKDSEWDVQAFGETILVGAVVGVLAFPVLAVIPSAFVTNLLAKLDDPGERAWIVAFISYVISHIVAARIRDKIPGLLGQKVDAELDKAVKP